MAAARDADGRAIGGACRHAGRAIEDCYALNKKADRAAIFAGWRDMNDYMRENKIEPVAAAHAARGLLESILFFSQDPDLVNLVFLSACEFVSRVPVYRLAFVPDSRVWDMIV